MFGDNVKSRRIQLGLSQSDLAKCVGKEQQNIQQIESGVVRNPRYMAQLLKALRCSYEDLVSGEFTVNRNRIREGTASYSTDPGPIAQTTKAIKATLDSGQLSASDLNLIEQLISRLVK